MRPDQTRDTSNVSISADFANFRDVRDVIWPYFLARFESCDTAASAHRLTESMMSNSYTVGVGKRFTRRGECYG